MNNGDGVGLQFFKVIQVFLIIFVPVCIGMLIRHKAPNFADKLAFLMFSLNKNHIFND